MKLVLAPLQAWAEEAWDFQGQRKVQTKAWWQQKRKLEETLARAGGCLKQIWKRATGPAGACWATLQELGGKMVGPFKVELQGCSWDLLDECPQDVIAAVEEIWQDQRLGKWAAEEGRGKLRPGRWLLPARQLIGGGITAGGPRGTWQWCAWPCWVPT